MTNITLISLNTIPKIYTSYYNGKQIGKSISISRKKPSSPRKGHDFEHLPDFAPSWELLKYWNSSTKGVEAINYYTKVFNLDMASKNNKIDRWLNTIDCPITLNCYEADDPDRIDNPFCHRHLFGQIIKSKRPDLWGGEVAYTLYYEV